MGAVMTTKQHIMRYGSFRSNMHTNDDDYRSSNWQRYNAAHFASRRVLCLNLW